MPVTFIKNNSTGWTSNPNQAAFDLVVAQVFKDFSSYLDQRINTSYTIDFLWTTPGSPGSVAESTSGTLIGTTYSAIKTLLNAQRTDAVKSSAYAALPGSDPFPTKSYRIRGGHSALLNNDATYPTGFPGTHDQIIINSGLTFDTTVNGQTCAGGKWALYSAIMHELTEIVGRWSQLRDDQIAPLDLFSFVAGVLSNDRTSAARYMSWDNGVTNAISPSGSNFYFTYASGNDTGDYNVVDMFGGFVTGNPNIMTARDMQAVAVIGHPLSPLGQRIARIGGSLPVGGF